MSLDFSKNLSNNSDDNLSEDVNTILKGIVDFGLLHKLPLTGFERMLEFVKTIPRMDLDLISCLPKSFREITAKAVENQDITYHFRCKKCNNTVQKGAGTSKAICVCGEIVPSGSDFFVYIGVEKQIIRSLQVHSTEVMTFRQNLMDNSEDDGWYSDVWDGQILRNIKADESSILLSLLLNTDGASPNKCNSKSIWPIQLIQNYLPPSIRFKIENIIVCGLYYGSGDPDMQDFFEPLIKEFQLFEAKKLTMEYENQTYVLRPMVTHASLDLMAKAKVQHIQLFNSSNACTFCEHPGESVPGKKNKAYIRYVATDTPYGYRTHEETLETMLRVHRTKTIDCGVNGISCMAVLENFDIVNGFAWDYLHGALLGVTKTLVTLWTSSEYHDIKKYPFHIRPRRQRILNKRILVIKTASFISCRPRPITEMKQFKAKDFRNMLLYYLPVTLRGLIPSKYLKHFLLFSSAMYILLKSRISPEEINLADMQLKQFVREFQVLYGKQHVTMNLHLLEHAADRVRYSGPLWSHSTFPFESNNGFLLQLAKAPTDKLSQILKKYALRSEYPNKKDRSTEIRLLGEPSEIFLSLEETTALQREGYDLVQMEVYQRLKKGQTVFTSMRYTRPKITCNYFVEIDNDEYAMGMVKYYFIHLDEIYAMVLTFSVDDYYTQDIWQVSPNEECMIIPVSQIKCKYIHIHQGLQQYAVLPPNLIEIY